MIVDTDTQQRKIKVVNIGGPLDNFITPRKIIHQIDELIRDTHTSREKKVENLKNLAMTCWQEVIPEYENPEIFNKLETDEVEKRWASVRNEVEKYETKSQILYVLDWPASSGDFYWVK